MPAPKHAHRHRLVIAISLLGIVILFGVWAVQVMQGITQRATDDVARNISQDQATIESFIEQVNQVNPVLNESIDQMVERQVQEAQVQEAREKSELLLANTLLQRFTQEQEVAEEEEGDGIDGGQGEEVDPQGEPIQDDQNTQEGDQVQSDEDAPGV